MMKSRTEILNVFLIPSLVAMVCGSLFGWERVESIGIALLGISLFTSK